MRYSVVLGPCSLACPHPGVHRLALGRRGAKTCWPPCSVLTDATIRTHTLKYDRTRKLWLELTGDE
jgi:hypothetical protein